MIRKTNFMFLIGILLASSLVEAKPSKTTLSISEKEKQCLAKNIYYESKHEPEEGMVAVGLVTINRANHPSYPDDICKVVHQRTKSRCQFSWTCKKVSHPKSSDPEWRESLKIVDNLLAGEYNHWRKKYANSLHFHATYVNPKWKKQRIAKTGRHIFYN